MTPNQDLIKQASTFANTDGSDYRTEAELDLKKIGLGLDKIGITAVDLNQIWRNVTGKVEYEGQSRFFKMATTLAISQKLENEVLWNNFANSNLGDLELNVPKIIATGKLNGLSYYISEFVEGQPLAIKVGKNQPTPEIYNLAKYLPKIANFCANLQNNCYLALPNQTQFLPQISENRTLLNNESQILLRKTKSWLKPTDIIGTSLEPEVNLIEQNISDWKFCINHGDFVPWHILELASGELYLVDGEHASLKPDFYDIAYFYHRTFTVAQSPELATEFLKLAFSKLNQEKQSLFRKQFPSVLASRIIGGYFDAVNDELTDFSFHHELQNLLQQDKIGNFKG